MKRNSTRQHIIGHVVLLGACTGVYAMESASIKEIVIALADSETGSMPESEWNILREMISYKDMLCVNDGEVALPSLTKVGFMVLRKYLSVINGESLRELLLMLLNDESSQEFHEMMVAADYLGLESLINTFAWFFDSYFIFTFPPTLGKSISLADRDILRRLLALPIRLRAVSKEVIEGTFLGAAQKGDKETLKFLLEDGCVDIDCKDIVKETALMMIIRHTKSKELAEFILGEGADVDLKNISGMNALMIAADALDDCIELVTTVFTSGEDKVDINEASTIGRTALMSASESGNAKVVDFLLVHGADVTRCDILHMNALVIACASFRDCDEVVEILLRHEGKTKLDVNETENGRNALSCASERGHEKIVAKLLNGGACVGLNEALRLAAKENHEGVMKLLSNAGAVVEQDTADDLAEEALDCWF